MRQLKRPRLVAFDVDGTLVGRDLRISPRVRDAVARMLQAGIAGCLVTGRMYRATIPFARELGLETPIICYQGAAIIDPDTDEVIAHSALSNDVVRELVDMADRDSMHLQLYRNDEYYCEARNRFSDLYASLSFTQPVIVPSLREAFAYSPATKAVMIADEPVAAAYARTLAATLTGRAYVTRSLPEFVEVLDPSVDKGSALRFVAGRLGVGIDETMAVGDSWNDAPLLEAAGFAIAMGSAPDELRAVADAIVGDLAHDGVAEAIEQVRVGVTGDARTQTSTLARRANPSVLDADRVLRRLRRGSAGVRGDVAGLRSAARRRAGQPPRRDRRNSGSGRGGPARKHLAAEHARDGAPDRGDPVRCNGSGAPDAAGLGDDRRERAFAVCGASERRQRRHRRSLAARADARRTGVRVAGARDQAGFGSRTGRVRPLARRAILRSAYDAMSAHAIVPAELAFDRFGGIVATLPDGPRLLLGSGSDLDKKLTLARAILSQVVTHQRPVAAIDLRAPATPVLVYR